MSVMEGKELRIVGFLCNWCSYGGADTAGVGRFAQPTDLRIIKLPCTGRINPLFIVRALLNGADGVLVSGWTQAVMSDAQAAPQTKEETAQRATPPPTPPPPIT